MRTTSSGNDSGGLSARTDLNATNVLDELLKQKRYWLFEGGHRWIDMRRYGRLSQLALSDPPGAGFVVQARFPIPQAEMDARQ